MAGAFWPSRVEHLTFEIQARLCRLLYGAHYAHNPTVELVSAISKSNPLVRR